LASHSHPSDGWSEALEGLPVAVREAADRRAA